MNQQRSTLIASMAALVLALFLPAGAQASEVVKLARLVITGKRLSAAPAPQPAPQQTLHQLPRVVVEGHRVDEPPRVLAERRPVLRLL